MSDVVRFNAAASALSSRRQWSEALSLSAQSAECGYGRQRVGSNAVAAGSLGEVDPILHVTKIHSYVFAFIAAYAHVCSYIYTVYIYILYIHIIFIYKLNTYAVHYITLGYITLRYLSLHYIHYYIPWHDIITSHYMRWHYTYTTVHCIKLHCIELHYIKFHYIDSITSH